MAPTTDLDARNTTNIPTSKYRPEIDGLRAFAVVAVIINHFNRNLLPGGYLGVDIFFVISGYVITSSLAERRSKNFLDFVTSFYERRIKRLAPALVVFVLITSVLISIFSPETDLALKTGGASLLGLSNTYLLRQLIDYFAPSTDLNPFTHTWSLGVEEQFYLLFPFLIWFSGFGPKAAKGARNLLLWTGGLSITSVASFIYLYQANQPAAYFLMPPRFWEMAAGCLIFIACQKRAKIEEKLEKAPPLLVLAAMAGVMLLPAEAAVIATISTVALSAVLIACLKKGTTAYNLLTINSITSIGLISYSLYLWHWAVLCISRWTIGIHWWSAPFQAGLMLLLAKCSYSFIELPLRKSTWPPKRWMNLSGGFALSAIALAANRAIASYSEILYAGGTSRGEYTYSERKYWKHERCMKNMYDRDKAIAPSQKDFADCYFLPNPKKPKSPEAQIFWYGNSYNEQLMPAAARINRQRGLTMNSFGAQGCLATLSMDYYSRNDSKYQEYCDKLYASYLDYFLGNAPGGSKIIIATNIEYFAGPAGDASPFRHNEKLLNYRQARYYYAEELRRLSEPLNKKNLFLVVTSGIPVLEANPNICASHWSKTNNTCKQSLDRTAKEENTIFATRLKTLAPQTNNRITFADLYTPLERLLRAANQPIFRFYFNSKHLNREGALLLVPALEKAIGRPEQISD